jgi:hypothetical protein
MVRLKICDIPSIKRHCLHYYSCLATFLSDEELSKEFECVLFNKESKYIFEKNFDFNNHLKTNF